MSAPLDTTEEILQQGDRVCIRVQSVVAYVVVVAGALTTISPSSLLKCGLHSNGVDGSFGVGAPWRGADQACGSIQGSTLVHMVGKEGGKGWRWRSGVNGLVGSLRCTASLHHFFWGGGGLHVFKDHNIIHTDGP